MSGFYHPFSPMPTLRPVTRRPMEFTPRTRRECGLADPREQDVIIPAVTDASVAAAKAHQDDERRQLREIGIEVTDAGARLSHWSRPFVQNLDASVEVSTLAVVLDDVLRKCEGRPETWDELGAGTQQWRRDQAIFAVRHCLPAVQAAALHRAGDVACDQWDSLVKELQAKAVENAEDVEVTIRAFVKRIVSQYVVAVRDGAGK